MSPGAMTLMMYGLPLLTVVFTWWLPAALQLSFFISGLLSFGQSSLFKLPAFRRYFDMLPLDHAAAPPPSPYKNNMKVRAPLSQAELNRSFQQSRKQGILQKAKSSLLDTTKEIRGSASSVVEQGRGYSKGSMEKAEKKRREEYEKRRQAEIRADLEERERERERKRRLSRARAPKKARREE